MQALKLEVATTSKAKIESEIVIEVPLSADGWAALTTTTRTTTLPFAMLRLTTPDVVLVVKANLCWLPVPGAFRFILRQSSGPVFVVRARNRQEATAGACGCYFTCEPAFLLVAAVRAGGVSIVASIVVCTRSLLLLLGRCSYSVMALTLMMAEAVAAAAIFNTMDFLLVAFLLACR